MTSADISSRWTATGQLFFALLVLGIRVAEYAALYYLGGWPAVAVVLGFAAFWKLVNNLMES